MRGVIQRDLRAKAVRLRKQGLSVRTIENRLGVAKSTLSGWLRNVELTESQKTKLLQNHRNGLVTARKQAVAAHRLAKERRIDEAKTLVEELISQRIFSDPAMLELALAMLYLGEGAKTRPELILGNSNPMILRFYITALEQLYGVRPESLRLELHLRADQDEERLKNFWSKELNVPMSCFRYSIKDPRTIGKPTRPGYYGVCTVGGGTVAIQRKLLYLAEAFCKKTSKTKRD